MTPRVTVLMTVYNGLPYLPQAIESVLNQTLRNFEFLIVDDGSTDDSVACIRSYRDPRIRVLCNETNLGQARSLNRGLSLARAPYLARLDQDDAFLPDRLRRQVAVLDARPDVAVVGSWVYYVRADGRKTGVVGMPINDFGMFLGALLTFASPFGHTTAMFRRDVVLALGGYDVSFAPCEDYELWGRLALHRHGAISLPNPLMCLRIHEQQQSQQRFGPQQACARAAHTTLVQALGGPRDDAERLSALLRMDEEFWDSHRTPPAVQEALRDLEGWLAGVGRTLQLTPREGRTLRHRIAWWLGHGALMGILRQRYQSLPIFVSTVRADPRMCRYPAVFLYPAGALVAPLLIPAIRRWCLRMALWCGRQKYVVRLLLDRAPHDRGRRILYMSYDGMLEPLGASQVVGYLMSIAQRYPVTLLSYEKRQDLRDPARLGEMSQQLESAGIRWIRLRYHKRPTLIATGWDVLQGILVGLWACRRHRIFLVHARGYVPSVIAVILKRLRGVKFLFDMRGFWVDEKVDAGHWVRGSFLYRVAKRWERRFFEQADAMVSLTTAGVAAFPTLGYRIAPTTPVEVIPTCADLTRFVPGKKDPTLLAKLGLEGCLVLGCVGTLSNWYLRRPMLEYLAFLATHLDRVKVLFVTREDHQRLREDALAAGLRPEQIMLTRAAFSDMPRYLRFLDLGVFFITPAFSKRGSAATKLAELLATGVPVVINEGVGDSAPLIRQHRVGVVLSDASPANFATSLADVKALLGDPMIHTRCREVAQRYFDLDAGVMNYLHLYRRLDDARQPHTTLEPALSAEATPYEP